MVGIQLSKLQKIQDAITAFGNKMYALYTENSDNIKHILQHLKQTWKL